MLCQKCKKNEARINLIKMVNGHKEEIWLCEECARNIADIPFIGEMGDEIDESLQGFLTGVINNISSNLNKSVSEEIDERICPNCGTNYNSVLKTGKVGCSKCYDTFDKKLLKDKKKGLSYVGKIPKKNSFDLSRKRKLKSLKESLQNLILEEKYEQAAIVRDSINELERDIINKNLINKTIIEGEKCNGKLE